MREQTLLIELLVEELPPKALPLLGQAFARGLAQQLQAQGLVERAQALDAGVDLPSDAASGSWRWFATPRRLAVQIARVRSQAADRALQQKIMPLAVGLDADGRATPALLKKLAALGLGSEAAAQLQRGYDGKTEMLILDRVQPGIALAAGLQSALQQTLTALPIPKLMTYPLHQATQSPGWDRVSFVRPAHSLIALHGDAVVPVAVLGLTAGRSTLGHRFEALEASLQIAHAADYASVLRERGAVVACYEQRRADIRAQLDAAAASLGQSLRVVDDPALLAEVTALVERANVLSAGFDAAFLQVPQECLILTMKANQKYFPLLDAHGKLTNRFLLVSNIRPGDPSAIVGGNERVLRARLADAKFFFDQDRKRTLASRAADLHKVVYHHQLGTQAERTERVRAIAHAIVARLRAAQLPYTVEAKDSFDVLDSKVQEAARLAKADLLTDMVGEFPQLQGIMGAYYARHEGLRDGVALAIEDHYKPRFAGDDLPRNHTATVLALADKLETLVGLFGIGQLPSGDKDPFALRRHAVGVIRLLVENRLDLRLDALIGDAAGVFGGLFSHDPSGLQDFIFDRLAVGLREQGYSAQEVDAVLALREPCLADIPQRLQALRRFAQMPQAAALAAANKRIGNLLKKAQTFTQDVASDLLHEPAEHDLAQAMQAPIEASQAAYARRDYAQALALLAPLRDPVDAFFAQVMVNADDPALRANRLALLARLHQAMNRVADLARLSA